MELEQGITIFYQDWGAINIVQNLQERIIFVYKRL